MAIAAHDSSSSRSETQPASSKREAEVLMQDAASGVGAKAALDEKGYKAVAKLKSNKEMEAYVRRVLNKLGLHVVDEGALKGVVPYYSGKKSTQSYAKLVEEIKQVRQEKKRKKRWLKTHAEFKKEEQEKKQKEKEKEAEDEEEQEKEEDEEEEDV